MNPYLFIRVDASSDIGLGHLVRCISLAHMLKNDFKIHFFSLDIPKKSEDEITQLGWSITKLMDEDDFFNALIGSEVVVLDGYQFDSRYQKQIKQKGCKLVCIDDFHDQYFYADLVINHAPGVTKEDYKGEPYTKYLLGLDYALLRPEFLNSSSHENKKYSKGIESIFVCFGGSDSKNLTAKVLSWLPSKDYSVTIVLGNSYSHQDTLNKVIEERQDLQITVKNSLSAEEMRNELEQADLAIVPASGILFEVISIGLPVISGYYTENQKAIYNGFLERGVFIDANSFSEKSFTKAFRKLGSIDVGAMVNKQMKLIDNYVKNRMIDIFLELC